MENQSNISCEGHTEYLPLNDSSVSDRMQSAEDLDFYNGGEIYSSSEQLHNMGYLQLCILVISECIQGSS